MAEESECGVEVEAEDVVAAAVAVAEEAECGVEVEAVPELHAAEGLIAEKPVHSVAVVVFED